MLAIFKKELKIYFTSILGYIMIGAYLLIAGGFFTANFLLSSQGVSDFSGFFSGMNTVFLFIIPIITFRILSEEKRLGTYELLMTSPVTPWEIILGKFFAVLIFVWIGASILLVYPLVLSFFAAVEWGAVLSGYLGILFTLALFISAGIFASSTTSNFVVAGILSFAIFLFLYVISYFGYGSEGLVPGFFREISYSLHYNRFATGIIAPKDILYFLIGTFFWLFLAETVVETRTWK